MRSPSQRSVLTTQLNPWAIEWPCYVVWGATFPISIAIVAYLNYQVQDECWKYKPVVMYASYAISFTTMGEALVLFAFWVLNLAYKCFHIGKLCGIVVGCHCLMAASNIAFAIMSFLAPVCLDSLNDLLLRDYRHAVGIKKLVVKYEVRIAGMLHILLAILLVASAMFLAKHRSDYKFQELKRRGLLVEYMELQGD